MGIFPADRQHWSRVHVRGCAVAVLLSGCSVDQRKVDTVSPPACAAPPCASEVAPITPDTSGTGGIASGGSEGWKVAKG